MADVIPAPGVVVWLALAPGVAWRVVETTERTVFLVPLADETDYTAADLDAGDAPRMLWLDLDAFQADLRDGPAGTGGHPAELLRAYLAEIEEGLERGASTPDLLRRVALMTALLDEMTEVAA